MRSTFHKKDIALLVKQKLAIYVSISKHIVDFSDRQFTPKPATTPPDYPTNPAEHV